MKAQFSIPQSAIKAVAYAMAVKDIRHCFNGMLMQHNGQETRLIATDGDRLHACIVKHKDAELLPEVIEAIIPDSLVKTILKTKPGRYGYKEIAFTIDGTRIQADLFDGTSTVATAIDGKFPDYHRVIPTEFSGEVTQYNPEYLLDAELGAQAWLESGKATPCFCHNGDSAGGIALDGFVAIVMPRRADATLNAPDAAFKLYPAKAEPQAIAGSSNHASNLHNATPASHARHTRRCKLAHLGAARRSPVLPQSPRTAAPDGTGAAVASRHNGRLLTMTTAESLLIAAIIAALGLYAAPDLVAWWNGFHPVMVK